MTGLGCLGDTIDRVTHYLFRIGHVIGPPRATIPQVYSRIQRRGFSLSFSLKGKKHGKRRPQKGTVTGLAKCVSAAKNAAMRGFSMLWKRDSSMTSVTFNGRFRGVSCLRN